MKGYIVLIFLLTLKSAGAVHNLVADNKFNQWTYDRSFHKYDTVAFDTSFLFGYQYNEAFKSFDYAYLGNLGTPVYPYQYRFDNAPFLFGRYDRIYFLNEADFAYYNVKRPFTDINFTLSGNKTNQEQFLNIVHTQNVNPYLNLGFKVNSILSFGQYFGQRVATRNLQLFKVYDKNRIYSKLVAGLNLLQREENGGFINDSALFDEIFVNDFYFNNQVEGINRDPDAYSRNRQRKVVWEFGYQLMGDSIRKDSLRSASKWVLGHRFNLEDNMRDLIVEEDLFDYFDTSFASFNLFSDSAYFRTLESDLSLTWTLAGAKTHINQGFILKNAWQKYAHNQLPDTANVEVSTDDLTFTEYRITKEQEKSYYNSALTYFLHLTHDKIGQLYGVVDYHVAGYFAGDFALRARLLKSINQFDLKGAFRQQLSTPSYFNSRYTSNFLAYEQTLNKVEEQVLEGSIAIKKAGLSFTFYSSRTRFPIYFSNMGMPMQSDQTNYSLMLRFSNNSLVGKNIRLRNQLSYFSNSLDQIIPTPNWVLYHSLSLQGKLFKKVLSYQLGYDLRIHDKYNAPHYNFVMNQFASLNDEQTTIGAYPFLDVFLNILVKRTSLFIKIEHVNMDLLQNDLQHKYYTIPHYPHPQRVLRFGVRWFFAN